MRPRSTRRRAEPPAGTASAPPPESAAPSKDLIHGWAALCQEVGVSRWPIWRAIKKGLFPAPIVTGPASAGRYARIAWHRSEIEKWKKERPRRTYGAPAALQEARA